MELKIKSKYPKEYSNIKKNRHQRNEMSDEMSFRAHDPSILKSERCTAHESLDAKTRDLWGNFTPRSFSVARGQCSSNVIGLTK